MEGAYSVLFTSWYRCLLYLTGPPQDRRYRMTRGYKPEMVEARHFVHDEGDSERTIDIFY